MGAQLKLILLIVECASRERPFISIPGVKPSMKQREHNFNNFTWKDKKWFHTEDCQPIPTWNQTKSTIRYDLRKPGVINRSERFFCRDTCLWKDNVQMKLHEKTRLYCDFLVDKRWPIGNLEEYELWSKEKDRCYVSQELYHCWLS